MIKSYTQLSMDEREEALSFLNRKEEKYNSLYDLDAAFKEKIYDNGEGVLFYFKDKKVVGKLMAILKEAKTLKKAYLINIEFIEEINESDIMLLSLINHGKNLAKEYGATNIFLGTRNEKVINVLEDNGLYKEYDAVMMSLDNREKQKEIFQLTPVRHDNKLEYVNIHNEAFTNVPNGAPVSVEDIDKYLRDKKDGENYFLVQNNNENIGIMCFEISDSVGMFDMGLGNKYRGKGFGRILLETAINFLNEKKVEEISLVVITKNTVAYRLYIERGFKKSKVLSHWFTFQK